MTIRTRSLVAGSIIVFASVMYGVARYYSPSLVYFVVEQSLIQKIPPGMNTAALHERFRAHIAATPDKKAEMKELLQISEYLEKVQHLSLEEIDNLLPIEKPGGH